LERENPVANRAMLAVALACSMGSEQAAAASLFFHIGLECAVYEPDRAKLVLTALQEFVVARRSSFTLEEVIDNDREEGRALLDQILTEPPAHGPTLDLGQCRSCAAPIYWTITKAGKRSPMSLDPLTQAPYDPPRSHFADCPDRRQWRKGS